MCVGGALAFRSPSDVSGLRLLTRAAPIRAATEIQEVSRVSVLLLTKANNDRGYSVAAPYLGQLSPKEVRTLALGLFLSNAAAVMAALFPLALIGIAVISAVLLYNTLILARNRTCEAWSGIEVQLKRRSSLIPNLVETVRGYATHEHAVFSPK